MCMCCTKHSRKYIPIALLRNHVSEAQCHDAEEAYVFTCFDSRTDGRARFTPHTAIKSPLTSPDAPPRKSIEIRALVFWENGSVDEDTLDAY